MSQIWCLVTHIWPLNYVKFKVSLHLWETSLYNYVFPILFYMVATICLVLLWPVHASNLCCTIVGPSYTMSAQHKSNIGSASFICVIVDVLFCKTRIPAAFAKWLQQPLFVWCWGIISDCGLTWTQRWIIVSTIHWLNIGLKFVHCLRHRPNIRKTLGRCRPIVFTLWDWQWWIDVCQSSTTLAGHKINIDHIFRMYLLTYIIQQY